MVTLVLDKGAAALANTVELQAAGVGWISALPGVRAAAEKLLVHGQEDLCVLKYAAAFAGEQLHSLTTSLSKVLQALRRFSMELNKPQARWKEDPVRSKIQRWLSVQFLEALIRYQIQSRDGRSHLQFEFDTAAWQQLVDHRLGRTMRLTNRRDWTAGQVAIGYSGQPEAERVFRSLQDGDWLGWGPMYPWTDRKIRIHAFYCMLGIALWQHLHKQA
jgi:transposase